MPALTYFLLPDTQLLDTVDPGAEATALTGWTVGTHAPTAYADMVAGTKRLAGTFTTTVVPGAGGPGTVTGDFLGTGSPLTGTFAAGVWTATFKAIAVSSGGDQDGNIRFRIWKNAAASPTGTGSTELTSAAIDGATITNLTTAASQASAGSTASIGPFTLTNEYLFLTVAWKITGVGGAITRDVLLRKGTGITLVTPSFTASGASSAPPFQARTARNMLLRR